MKYYHNTETGSIYKTENIIFSNGEPTLRVSRWNDHTDSWGGHIHNHEKTRRQIAEGKVIVEITKEKAIQIIGQKNID